MKNIYTKLSSKSIGWVGDLAACPQLERVPLIYCIAERSREKVRWQRSHEIVKLYGCSHLMARHEASLL